MDFDDLDEVDDVVVNNQIPKGKQLPLIKRSPKIPSGGLLPFQIQKRLPPFTEEPKTREPKVRLLCTMGAADNVCQEWCFWEQEAPAQVDMVTHEPPGHGTRKPEPVSNTLEAFGDDAFGAFREAMDTGSFVLLGHSIGCLAATYIAERAKRELNVEPLLAIMIERGAPHLPAFSDYGFDMLKTDPLRFLKIRDPSTAKGIEMGPKDEDQEFSSFGEQILRMWGNDLQIENDTRPVGWYKFPCPVLVFRCPSYYKKDVAQDVLDRSKEHFEIHSERDFMGHFGKEWCEAWSEWTTHPRGATCWCIDGTNHMSIKAHPEMRRIIWSELEAVLKGM